MESENKKWAENLLDRGPDSDSLSLIISKEQNKEAKYIFRKSNSWKNLSIIIIESKLFQVIATSEKEKKKKHWKIEKVSNDIIQVHCTPNFGFRVKCW